MNNSRTFTTAKGTELPLLNLKGRDYLEVKYRLVWFREEHPDWSIETEFLRIDERSATARAGPRQGLGKVDPAAKNVDIGEFQVNFGKKYLGKRLKEIPRDEIESYLEWLEKNAVQKKSGPSFEVTMLKEAVDRYYHPEKFRKADNVETAGSAEEKTGPEAKPQAS